MSYRKIGLRLRIPKGAGPFPGKDSAVLFDIESGDPLSTDYGPLIVNYDAAGAIRVTTELFPEAIEIIETP